MTKKVKTKNLNMFVRNNRKKDHVHVIYPLLYVAKKKKHKATLFMGAKKKKKT
jgi:hypothetical protein